MYVKNIYLTKRRHQQNSTFKPFGRVLTVLVGVAVVLSLVWITRSFVLVAPYFNVNEVVVVGNNTIPKEDIIKSTGVSFGQNVFKLNLIKVQYQVKENPLFDKVHVKRCFPDKIEIHVEERKPSALLNIKGDLYLVSDDCVIFKKLSSVIYENLPIITNVNLRGVVLGSVADSFGLKTGLKILRDVKSVQPEFLNCISEINVGNTQEIVVYTDNGTKLKVDGKTDKGKWAYVSKAISAAGADKISIGYIDIRYNKQIVLGKKT